MENPSKADTKADDKADKESIVRRKKQMLTWRAQRAKKNIGTLLKRILTQI